MSVDRDKIYIGIFAVFAMYLDWTGDDLWAGFFGVYTMLAVINMNVKRIFK